MDQRGRSGCGARRGRFSSLKAWLGSGDWTKSDVAAMAPIARTTALRSGATTELPDALHQTSSISAGRAFPH